MEEKERSLKFEREYSDIIGNYCNNEILIKEQSEMRLEWISSLSQQRERFLTYKGYLMRIIQLKLEILKRTKETEHKRLEETLDQKQTINDSRGKSNIDSVDHQLKENLEISRQNLIKYNCFLDESRNEILSLQLEYEQLLTDRCDDKINKELTRKLLDFKKAIHEKNSLVREGLQQATRDYLLLRHNAKQAKEKYSQLQADNERGRLKLQGEFETLIHQLHFKKADQKRSLKDVMDIELCHLREQVIKQEEEYASIMTDLSVAKSNNRTRINQLRSSIEKYTDSCNQVLVRRAKDKKTLTREMKRLKEHLNQLELKLFNFQNRVDPGQESEMFLNRNIESSDGMGPLTDQDREIFRVIIRRLSALRDRSAHKTSDI